jgi:hypothetical protein
VRGAECQPFLCDSSLDFFTRTFSAAGCAATDRFGRTPLHVAYLQTDTTPGGALVGTSNVMARDRYVCVWLTKPSCRISHAHCLPGLPATALRGRSVELGVGPRGVVSAHGSWRSQRAKQRYVHVCCKEARSEECVHSEGMTPLHIAVAVGNMKAVDALLSIDAVTTTPVCQLLILSGWLPDRMGLSG